MSEAVTPAVEAPVPASAVVDQNTSSISTAPTETLNKNAETPSNPAASQTEAPGSQPAKEEAAKLAVPDKYELKLSEGSKLEAKRIDELAAYAKEKGLSQEAAQDLLSREEKAVSDYHERETAAYQARQAQWQETVKNDPEIGGANFNRTLALSNRVVERFASPALKQELQTTGLGNYPELVRFIAAIGNEMADDSFVQPGTQSGGAQLTAAERMFPNSK